MEENQLFRKKLLKALHLPDNYQRRAEIHPREVQLRGHAEFTHEDIIDDDEIIPRKIVNSDERKPSQG